MSTLGTSAPPPSAASWLAPALIGASVAVATIIASQYLLASKDALEHWRKISEVQGKIIRDLKDKESAENANLLISEELEVLYLAFRTYPWSAPDMTRFDSFKSRIVALRQKASDQNRIEPAQPLSSDSLEPSARSFNTALPAETAAQPSISTTDIQTKFNSGERLKYSDALVVRSKQSAVERDAIAGALVRSVLPDNDGRSYRINLYIAFTLARFPDGWTASADPNKAIDALKTSRNYRDSQFKRRVDEAIDNRI